MYATAQENQDAREQHQEVRNHSAQPQPSVDESPDWAPHFQIFHFPRINGHLWLPLTVNAHQVWEIQVLLSGREGGGCKCFFFCIFFFCICLAFSFLVFWQTMGRCVPCGVANDAAADADDTPELTDGVGPSEPDSEEPENKKVKLNHGAKTTPAFIEILRAGSIQCDTNMKDVQHHLLWTKSSGVAPCLHCSWGCIFLHLRFFCITFFAVSTCIPPLPPCFYYAEYPKELGGVRCLSRPVFPSSCGPHPRPLMHSCPTGIVLDGVPRTLQQAKLLDSFLNVDVVINLFNKEEVLVQKLAGRRVCPECNRNFNVAHVRTECGYHMEPLLPKGDDPTICDGDHPKPVKLITRSDDTEEVVWERLQVYQSQTLPILEFYQSQPTTLIDFEAKNGKKDYPQLRSLLCTSLEEQFAVYFSQSSGHSHRV